ncbi:uncharacterized protein DSM5745_09441 [Aspergillus mulundensis]|uniref:Apple domain-containing protein n=1 Tax=Aspergillus mulundensis TaxID=1810919 RepID=A0A3D8QVB0_9EURO|nr:hypothetical protein DSM5745_09441 [Aspergillus mulundensis]RDW65702.1 hypothetical protein DSM5745_09441 [Aspergillus mulundensis]
MMYKAIIPIVLGLSSFFPSALADPTCLSPSTPGGVASKNACCPSTSSQGEDPVDGTVYEYKCGAYAKKDYLSGGTASSALDCARQCAAQATASQPCHAANWGPDNNECHLYGSGFGQRGDTSGDWILLVRTDRAAQDCQDAIDQAVGVEKVDCQTKLNDKDLDKTKAVNAEKTACTKQVNDEKSACTKQVNDEKSACTKQVNDEKSACTKQVNDEKSACTKDENDRKSILGRRHYTVYYDKQIDWIKIKNNLVEDIVSPHLCYELCALDSTCRHAYWQGNYHCYKITENITTADLRSAPGMTVQTAIFN